MDGEQERETSFLILLLAALVIVGAFLVPTVARSVNMTGGWQNSLRTLVTSPRSFFTDFMRVQGELVVSFVTGAFDTSHRVDTTVPFMSVFPGNPSTTTERVIPAVNDASRAIINSVFSSAPQTLLSRIGTPQTEASGVAGQSELPIKIVINGAHISSSISNPSSTDLPVLEQALLSGAARFPTTARLGEKGTMLIFGHSSYLPKINNPAFRTFDGVQDLKAGDIISIYSATGEYRYAFRNVRVMDAADASANTIMLPDDKPYLVIVTCDTFASKSSRFVVDADFIEKKGL